MKIRDIKVRMGRDDRGTGTPVKVMRKKDKITLTKVLEKLQILSRFPYQRNPTFSQVELVADEAICLLKKVLK